MSRPEIGLALGGGVARGWIHIGVLRRLLAAGIIPDVVAGTSIGAVVGGLYLAGHLDALEAWARSLTQQRLLGYFDINWGGNSLIQGERLAERLADYLGERCIETLTRPFVAVATDLRTGNEIWLRQGTLVQSLRASYALPGVFAPVTIDGRRLVDGGLVNPCPTSVARAIGGRFVIAVSLHTDHYGHHDGEVATAGDTKLEEATRRTWGEAFESLRPDRILLRQLLSGIGAGTGAHASLSSVMLSALNILLDRVSRARLAGDPADVVIAPPVGHLGLLDFHRAEEMIALGHRAAELALPEIESRLAMLS